MTRGPVGPSHTRPVNARQRGWRASQRASAWSVGRPAERTFRQADIPSVRRLAAEFGAATGIGRAQLPDFVLAVSEAAACAVAGGPGTARLRLWATGPRVFCDVRGDLTPRQRAGGPLYGEVEATRRRLLRQLCEYASVSSGPDGARVQLSVTVA